MKKIQTHINIITYLFILAHLEKKSKKYPRIISFFDFNIDYL